jgi:lipoate-protein ligase B
LEQLNLRYHPENPESTSKKWLYVELPTVEYREAWDSQKAIVAARRSGIIGTDIVLFLEHHPVFTLGRRGGLGNLTVSDELLEKKGISIIQVERGGDITFHGPGQLVIYPIIDLRAARLAVVDYVTALEEVMIRTAADWGIRAERNSRNRGVWVGEHKLGSIGVSIRRGVSFHGLAFNVNTQLTPFSWIHPCGLENTQMTSLKRELSREVPMNLVRDAARHHFEAVFEVELVKMRLPQLKALLKNITSGSSTQMSNVGSDTRKPA